MTKQAEINQLHQALNDVLVGIQMIRVLDEDAREAKQDAILTALAMRKDMENLGLSHLTVDQRLGDEAKADSRSYHYQGERHD